MDVTTKQGLMEPDNKKPNTAKPKKKRRTTKWPKTNSLRFYRKLKGFTLESLGKELKRDQQFIQRREVGQTRLTEELAAEIGHAIGMPYEFLGFTNGPVVYAWAVRVVPVIGEIDSELRAHFSESTSRYIGVKGATTGLRALVLGPGSSNWDGWVVLYDEDKKEDNIKRVFWLQEHENAKFLIKVKGGDVWQCKLKPSDRPERWHLETRPKEFVAHDVAVEWGCKITGVDPGRDLPTIAEIIPPHRRRRSE
jgi:transcriptional regulator with XRE-family HTH domain